MDEFSEDTFIHRLHISHLALVTLCLLFGGGFLVLSFVYPSAQTFESVAALQPVSTPPQQAFAASGDVGTSSMRILFVGDIFFDRHIRFVGSTRGVDYPFSCIDPLLHSADFVIGNMEGPITTNKSVSLGSVPGSANNYRFTFPTTTAAALARHNVRAVSIGNNHILNFGYAGLYSTHEYLEKAGVGYFGGVTGSEAIYRIDEGDIHLSFIGYNEFGGSSPKEIATAVAAEHTKGRLVVVFAHWGTEYSTNADAIRPWATLFAAAGATAVIGAHPHVVGLKEKVRDTVIYYSLGNFIFDQYFSEDVRHGLAVMLTLSPQGVEGTQEYKTELERDGRVCVVH